MIHIEHPNHVVAISAVYALRRYDPDDPCPPILCIGTFSVERVTDTEARFHATHRTFDPDQMRFHARAHVAALLNQHTVAVGCAPMEDPGELEPSFIDYCLPGTQRIAERQRRIIECSERQLVQLARPFGLTISETPADLFQQKSEAADRAQATWLTFLQFCTDQDERNALLASWQAWSALQRAAPIPF